MLRPAIAAHGLSVHARASSSAALALESPQSPEGPKGLLVEPGVVRYFVLENIAVVAWYAAPTVHAIEELYRLGEPTRRRYPRGGSIVHVLCGDRMTIMDGPARDAMVRVTNALGELTAAVAVVLAVDGFLATVLIALGICVFATLIPSLWAARMLPAEGVRPQ